MTQNAPDVPFNAADRRIAKPSNLLGIFALFLISLKSQFQLQLVRDIGLDDESLYLASGVLLGKPIFPNAANGLIPAQSGPVYSCWYAAIARFISDRMALYYANWFLLTFVLAAGIFLVARRLGASFLLAIVPPFLLINSDLMEVWPFQVHFATGVLLVSTLAATFASARRNACRVLLVGTLIASFARPEFAFGYIAVALVLLFEASRAKRIVPVLADLALCVTLAAIPITLFGMPLAGGRSFFAFGQHYALNAIASEHSKLDPWLDWKVFTDRDFPGATTIPEAFSINSRAFLKHLAQNVFVMPKVLSDAFGFRFELPVVVQLVLSIGSIAFIIVGLVWALRARRQLAREPIAYAILVFAFVNLVVVLPSALVIRPRSHYVIPLELSALLVAIMGVCSWRRKRAPNRAIVAVAIACALVLITPNKAHGWTPQNLWKGPPEPALVVRVKLFEGLRRMHLRNPSVFVEPGWGCAFFAGFNNAKPYLQWQQDRPFNEFVQSEQVDVVIIDARYKARFDHRPDFSEFLESPARFGFVRRDLPEATSIVLVRDTVLTNEEFTDSRSLDLSPGALSLDRASLPLPH